ncbi:MAG: polymerase [Clostridiales bacterium]|jgi:DNA polymerase-4|nr:polymerase [Clostridiales bacterium]MDN5298299.1 polymerase [Clostridiales bacterium]
MKTIFHIDVNSAYLSWEAVYRLQHGFPYDLREVPSVVTGNPKARRGIILAKSIPAKKFNIQTGESLYAALKKCPTLELVGPSYGLYMKASQSLVDLLKNYSPDLQRFSIDECFLEITDVEHLYQSPVDLANTIRRRIKNELGFTVNIGVSSNKLLAKVASDFTKPNRVHTLYPEEVPTKLWPLPVGDLFMVGRATTPKLNQMGIYTVGDLAKADLTLLRHHFKSHADVIWQYANGIETSEIRIGRYPAIKGIGNSTTIPFDVTDRRTAHMYLLSLTEMVGARLRAESFLCGLVSVSIKTDHFKHLSHQKKLHYFTDVTSEIFYEVCQLFDSLWDGTPIRHLGVRVSMFIPVDMRQISIWESPNHESRRTLDRTIDHLRTRYGPSIISRGTFANTSIKGIAGGVPDHDDYPMMASML